MTRKNALKKKIEGKRKRGSEEERKGGRERTALALAAWVLHASVASAVGHLGDQEKKEGKQ